jgi:hypothetical protein
MAAAATHIWSLHVSSEGGDTRVQGRVGARSWTWEGANLVVGIYARKVYGVLEARATVLYLIW